MKMKYLAMTLLITLMNMTLVEASELRKSCFSIEGMHCGNCIDKIKSKMSENTAIKDVDVSLRDSMAQVTFDPEKTDDTQVLSAVKNAGYKGKVIKCAK